MSNDPRLQPLLESLPASFALERCRHRPLAKVFGTREPVLFSTITAEYLDELDRLGADSGAFERARHPLA